MFRNKLCFVVLVSLTLHFCSAQEARRPESEQVLKIAHEEEFLSLDPQEKNDNVTFSVLGNIYEPLIEFDQNMKIVSRLAERWENPNDLTWRFYLRKNIRFHNGKPFSAADVVHTIQRALLNPNSGMKPYLISVKKAVVIDTHTVDIVTERPNPLLLNRLTFVQILPFQTTGQKNSFSGNSGTGPYIFERYDTPQKLLLRANAAYWKGKPSIQRVQFVSYPSDEETVNELLNKNVHVIRDFSEKLIPNVEASKNFNVVTHDGLAVTLLGFNLTQNLQKNPFLKLEVRKAVYFTLDSEAMVRVLGGRASIARQLISPNVFGFDPDYVAPEPDIQKAKMLLKEAGYPSGFVTDLYGVDDQRLRILVDQLARIGIQAKPQLIAWKDLYEKMVRNELPMYTMSWSCSTGDASDFYDSCIHSPDPQSGYGNFNTAGYNNPEVDRLIERSEQTLKISERRELLQQASTIVMRDLPYIPIYSRYNHYGISNRLTWQPRPDGRMYAFDMRWK